MKKPRSGTSPRLAALIARPDVHLRMPVIVGLRHSVCVGLLGPAYETSQTPAIEVAEGRVNPGDVLWVDGPQDAREFAATAFPVLEKSFFSDLIGLMQYQMRVRGGLATKGMTSERKRAASMENGAKGGRPRKITVETNQG